MFILSEVTNTLSQSHFPVSAIIVLAVGFVAAVTIGSITWYNAKRPVGWEHKEKPDFIPDIDK